MQNRNVQWYHLKASSNNKDIKEIMAISLKRSKEYIVYYLLRDITIATKYA